MYDFMNIGYILDMLMLDLIRESDCIRHLCKLIQHSYVTKLHAAKLKRITQHKFAPNLCGLLILYSGAT